MKKMKVFITSVLLSSALSITALAGECNRTILDGGIRMMTEVIQQTPGKILKERTIFLMLMGI